MKIGIVMIGIGMLAMAGCSSPMSHDTPPASPAATAPSSQPDAPPTKASQSPTSARDSRIETIQTRLNKLPGVTVDVTGVMNPQTKAAVVKFQKQHGLQPDGIVGPRTWAALNRAAADVDAKTSGSGTASSSSNSSCEHVYGDFCLVEGHPVSDEYNGYLAGTVRNMSDRAYGYVQVEINLYDASDHVLDSTLANVNNLPAGGVWHFKAISPVDGGYKYWRVENITGW
jgi:hypothetical protein